MSIREQSYNSVHAASQWQQKSGPSYAFNTGYWAPATFLHGTRLSEYSGGHNSHKSLSWVRGSEYEKTKKTFTKPHYTSWCGAQIPEQRFFSPEDCSNSPIIVSHTQLGTWSSKTKVLYLVYTYSFTCHGTANFWCTFIHVFFWWPNSPQIKGIYDPKRLITLLYVTKLTKWHMQNEEVFRYVKENEEAICVPMWKVSKCITK